MDYGADIGLVNSHSECVGGYHYAVTVISPGLLPLILDNLVKAGVIVCGGDAVGIQEIGHLLGARTVAHIYYARTRDMVKYMFEFHEFVLRLADYVGEVLTEETHAYNVLLLKAQFVLDIVCDLRRCCGGKCQHGDIGQFLADIGYGKI